jgi:putative ABC transport system substrate-binding protein
MNNATRRALLLSSGALLAAPLAAIAQRARTVRRIGYLALPPSSSNVAHLARQLAVEALRRAGYEEGGNLAIAWRYAEGKPERLRELADELIRLEVELIVAPGNYPTMAAQAATRTVPIVGHGLFLPVENGLIKALGRPGGNVTGTAWWERITNVDKPFELLKQALPRATRVAAMIDPNIPLNYQYSYYHGDEQLRNLAAIGLTLQRFELVRREDLETVLDRVARTSHALMVYVGNPVVQRHLREVIAFAMERKLVSMGDGPVYVDGGGLLYYGPDIVALWERTASYVDRILRGANPADLPVEQTAKWELVMNGKTARAIGFAPPNSFMLRVDRVIR